MINYHNLKNRVANTISPKKFRRKIFFIHLPKTGGTSVDNAFRDSMRSFGSREHVEYARHDSMAAAGMAELIHGYDFYGATNSDYDMQRFGIENIAYLMQKPKIKYISGHVCFDPLVYENFKASYDYVTVLRDPVKRFLSAFFYYKYRDVIGGRRRRLDITSDLESYARSVHGKLQGIEYTKYYGGLRKDEGSYYTQAAIDLAKSNLENFRVVGVLENINKFEQEVYKLYGVKIAIGNRNSSPANKSSRDSEISEQSMSLIRELCKPDIEIYNYIASKI